VKNSKEKKSGKEELFQLAKINDILDVFLYFVGLLIPLGDLFESMVGGAFDILLLIWLFPILRKDVVWVFLFECLDTMDLFFITARFDFIGLMELLPLWWWIYKEWVMKPESSTEKKSSSDKNSREIPEKPRICPLCEVEITYESKVCEYCGADLRNIKI
jgi:hypothetical protein